MMEQNEHIIKSQKFSIALNNKEEAHDVQSAISLLQESQITSLLNNILTKFSTENQIFKFNRIELNLGTINKNNYKNEVVYRLEEELFNYFNANILENGSVKNGEVIILNDRKLEQFEHFLTNGYLKWNVSSNQTPSILLNELIRENNIGLINLLRKEGKKEIVRKRIIVQFDEKSLENIVTVLSPSESIYIIEYKKEMLNHQQKNQLVETTLSSFRNVVWEVILAYILTESNSYYNKKSFLHYLIRKISKRFNLTYKSLLTVISIGVKKDNNSKLLEFKKIILELETEQKTKELSTQPKSDLKKEEIQSLIEHLNHFMELGTFTSHFKIESKNAFNQQIKTILKSKNQIVIHHLLEWVNNTSKRKKLLFLLNDEVLNEIIEIIPIFSVKESILFFDILNKNKSKFSTKSFLFFTAINTKRGRLILETQNKEKIKAEQILYNFLLKLNKEFPHNEVAFLELLKEIKFPLTKDLKKVVKLFISDHLKNKNGILIEKQIEKIISKIISFTNKNEIELWLHWINKNIEIWIKITGLNKKDLLKQIQKQLTKNVSSPHLISLIKKIETSAPSKTEEWSINNMSKIVSFENNKINNNNSIQLINSMTIVLLAKEIDKILSNQTLFSEWSRETILLLQKISNQYKISVEELINYTIKYLAQDSNKLKIHDQLVKLKSSTFYKDEIQKTSILKIEKRKKDITYYVLKKGVFPWWVNNYSWEDFNAGFKELLNNNSEKKELLLLLKKNTIELQLLMSLNFSNFQQIITELDTSKSNTYSNIITEIHNVLKKKLTPIHIVTSAEYDQFKEQILILTLKKDQHQIVLNLFSFIEKWISKFNIQQTVSIKNLFYHLFDTIKTTSKNTSLKTRIEELINKSLTLQKETINPQPSLSINEFLKNNQLILTKQQNNENENFIIDSLIQIIKTDQSQFIKSLINNKFRENIVNQIEEKNLIKLIRFNLNANQERFFIESVAILKYSGFFISTQEFDLLKRNYFLLILLKFSAGGFLSWRIEHWRFFLTETMINLFGKTKSNQILLKANDKLLSTKGVEYKKGSILIDSIHKTIMEDINKVKKITKKQEKENYRKLGEEIPRSFLDAIFIKNAGLIILAPYLGMLFEKCGLTQDGNFINKENQYKAVHMLEFAATGKSGKDEHELIINKLLCGFQINDVIELNIKLSKQEKETITSLLVAITQQWKPLKGTSIEGLRTSFLIRDGKLEEEEEQYYLKIEQKGFDILLDQITWNITKIKLSWMKKILQVEWR